MKKIFFLCSIIFLSLSTNLKAEVIYGKASWYSTKDACGKKTNNHPKCPTASGLSLFMLESDEKLFGASWIFKLGSIIRVTNQKNNKSVLVEIVDRGPAKRLNRPIDLGKLAFSKIADTRTGIIDVKLEQI